MPEETFRVCDRLAVTPLSRRKSNMTAFRRQKEPQSNSVLLYGQTGRLYNSCRREVEIRMETKHVILELREKAGLSHDELAEKVYVTRQAVSRWENGETTPNTETLKLLSQLFDVSINTLLGTSRQLICQCCGMPLEDSSISREPDGALNEEYCKWCYADGKFVYTNMDILIDFCAEHMSNENWPAEQVRTYMKEKLPQLNYWKRSNR